MGKTSELNVVVNAMVDGLISRGFDTFDIDPGDSNDRAFGVKGRDIEGKEVSYCIDITKVKEE